MTDDELRRALAERLGWTVIDVPFTPGSIRLSVTTAFTKAAQEQWRRQYPASIAPSLPSLSELVSTGEGRLTEDQKSDYGEAVAAAVLHIGARSGLSGFGCYKLITAPAAVRARALLETLPH